MITISDLSLTIAGKPILDGASVQIPSGHKVGIVGRNGIGKTTFLRLLDGELVADQGEFSLPKGARIGMLKQEAAGTDVSLLETVLAFDEERARLLFAVVECGLAVSFQVLPWANLVQTW